MHLKKNKSTLQISDRINKVNITSAVSARIWALSNFHIATVVQQENKNRNREIYKNLGKALQ